MAQFMKVSFKTVSPMAGVEKFIQVVGITSVVGKLVTTMDLVRGSNQTEN
jgi:hypothetical protein